VKFQLTEQSTGHHNGLLYNSGLLHNFVNNGSSNAPNIKALGQIENLSVGHDGDTHLGDIFLEDRRGFMDTEVKDHLESNKLFCSVQLVVKMSEFIANNGRSDHLVVD
jgi:hypothetical protein